MSKQSLLNLVDTWFNSDLDIEFRLSYKNSKGKALCIFESDVWYEHLNRKGVTYKSIRHKGDHRRLVVVESDDGLWEFLKQYCYTLYTKEELLNLINGDLAFNCRFYN